MTFCFYINNVADTEGHYTGTIGMNISRIPYWRQMYLIISTLWSILCAGISLIASLTAMNTGICRHSKYAILFHHQWYTLVLTNFRRGRMMSSSSSAMPSCTTRPVRHFTKLPKGFKHLRRPFLQNWGRNWLHLASGTLRQIAAMRTLWIHRSIRKQPSVA